MNFHFISCLVLKLYIFLIRRSWNWRRLRYSSGSSRDLQTTRTGLYFVQRTGENDWEGVL